MKYKKILLIFAFALLSLLFLNSNVYASSDLELKNLNYNVILNSDGSANVTETWKIYIEDTNTLFKTFQIDSSKYKEITNVSVSEISGNDKTNFSRIYEEQYHVNKNCFYALINSNNKFEIAWGAHAEDVTKTYEISYKIVDAVKNYSDCSQFYWQFISTESEIPARKITGKITLPTNVLEDEDLRVWAHGPLNGVINKTSNNTVSFEVEDFSSRTMLEARVVTPTYVFANNTNVSMQNKLSSILEEEQKWADEANAQREHAALVEKIITIGFIVLLIATNILGIFIAILILKKNKKYKEILSTTKKIEPSMKLDYYRDIPGENSTPAQASLLYYFVDNVFSANIPKIISATMLDLCLKKYLTFEPIANSKNDIKVILTNNSSIPLSYDEKLVFNLLVKVVKDNHSFTMKDFKKYAENHSSSLTSTFSEILDETKKIQQSKGNYDKKQLETANNYSLKGTGFILLAIFGFIPMIVCVIPSIMAASKCFKLYKTMHTLTQKGEDEKEQWKGLKKYMEDFSLLKEREVPELVLWEKYLVYATAFGISEKVLEQLKVTYPQISDSSYMNSHGYTYMYLLASNNFNNSFMNTLNTSVSNVYNTTYSSGSGAGGGFSGGGGFGGGGGRNGWKISKI